MNLMDLMDVPLRSFFGPIAVAFTTAAARVENQLPGSCGAGDFRAEAAELKEAPGFSSCPF